LDLTGLLCAPGNLLASLVITLPSIAFVLAGIKETHCLKVTIAPTGTLNDNLKDAPRWKVSLI